LLAARAIYQLESNSQLANNSNLPSKTSKEEKLREVTLERIKWTIRSIKESIKKLQRIRKEIEENQEN
jgi:hypothetical protein